MAQQIQQLTQMNFQIPPAPQATCTIAGCDCGILDAPAPFIITHVTRPGEEHPVSMCHVYHGALKYGFSCDKKIIDHIRMSALLREWYHIQQTLDTPDSFHHFITSYIQANWQPCYHNFVPCNDACTAIDIVVNL